MTLTVSISQFRNNMADYLDKVIAGNRILIRDEKKDTAIAELTKTKSFDKDAFEKILNLPKSKYGIGFFEEVLRFLALPRSG